MAPDFEQSHIETVILRKIWFFAYVSCNRFSRNIQEKFNSSSDIVTRNVKMKKWKNTLTKISLFEQPVKISAWLKTVSWVLQHAKTKELESTHEYNLLNGKTMVGNQTKTQVWEDLSLCPETSTKNADKEFSD